MFLAKSARVPLAQIKIGDRQRTDYPEDGIKSLAESMAKRGLIHPIVVSKDFELIAGGRRLRAAQFLGWPEIDCRFNNTEDPVERQIIELEENVKRSDLSWQDHCLSVHKLHHAFLSEDPSWTQEKTAEAVGYSDGQVRRDLTMAEEILAGNQRVIKAEKMSEARTVVQRERKRAMDDLTNTIFSAPKAKPPAGAPAEPEPRSRVIVGSFLDWCQTPQDERFHVVHCDFPYGVGMHKSGQVSKALDNYEDTPDIYFDLLSAFVQNYSNFALPVSHVMFWFSMDFYVETIAALGSIPNARVFPHPLIWYKSDKRGMMPDQMRQPRRVYETALLVSVGDRTLVRATDNCFPHPLDESRAHVSRKPPAMLEHFLSMLVGPGDRVLDPTCGSGSALVAAQALGATVFGMDISAEYVAGIKL